MSPSAPRQNVAGALVEPARDLQQAAGIAFGIDCSVCHTTAGIDHQQALSTLHDRLHDDASAKRGAIAAQFPQTSANVVEKLPLHSVTSTALISQFDQAPLSGKPG